MEKNKKEIKEVTASGSAGQFSGPATFTKKIKREGLPKNWKVGKQPIEPNADTTVGRKIKKGGKAINPVQVFSRELKESVIRLSKESGLSVPHITSIILEEVNQKLPVTFPYMLEVLYSKDKMTWDEECGCQVKSEEDELTEQIVEALSDMKRKKDPNNVFRPQYDSKNQAEIFTLKKGEKTEPDEFFNQDWHDQQMLDSSSSGGLYDVDYEGGNIEGINDTLDPTLKRLKDKRVKNREQNLNGHRRGYIGKSIPVNNTKKSQAV